MPVRANEDMGQTIGSQILGPWYDFVGWALGAAVFAYFAISGANLPTQLKASLPAFLKDRVTNMGLAGLFTLAAVGKFFHWW